MLNKLAFFAVSANILVEGRFSFNVINQDALMLRQVNQGLIIQLEVSQNIEYSSKDCIFCLLKDGTICHCYSSDEPISLPERCLSQTQYWLSSMLTCQNNSKKHYSTPLHVPEIELILPSQQQSLNNIDVQSLRQNKLTFVLPLEVGDLSRYAVLLRSLTQVSINVAHSLIVVVPDVQIAVVTTMTVGFERDLHFPVKILPQSILLPEYLTEHIYPYAIQMAIKLLISQYIKTDFYITLDADVIVLRDFDYSEIVINDHAIYHHESRYEHHPDWWSRCEQFLGFDSELPSEQGFGVTPAVLSTFGSLLVLGVLEQTLGDLYRSKWLGSFGATAIWSEYTLYRVVLDHLDVSCFCM